jgi:two-component system, sensor histidine kinase
MSYTTSNNTGGVESHFRQLYEEAPLPYQSLDSEARLLEVNRAWEDTFGYKREEVLGRFIGDFHVPGQEEKLRQGFIDFLHQDSVHAIEFEFSCKDGTRKLMSVCGRIARDSQGQFRRTHCILNDITERRIIEKALEESELKYRLAMEATQDGLWDWDVTTGNVYYSPSCGRILGEDNIPNNYSAWEDRIHPEDKPRILKTLRSHLAGETSTWNEEHRLCKIDGTWIWVLGRGQVVTRDRHGTPLRMVGTMTDINTRKQAEKSIRRSEERLKALINATTDDVVVLLDSNFNMEIVNERAARGFESTVEEATGHPLQAFMPLSIASRRRKHAQEVINSGQAVRFEDYRAGHWFDNNFCPVFDEQGSPHAVAIFARDITERKNLEQTLAKAKQTAEEANRSKTRFLAAASHDLRQPLQAITAHTDLLALSNTDPALGNSIKQLMIATQAMQEILEGLLGISQLYTGTITPDIKAFSISTLLSQLEGQYQPSAKQKGLAFDIMPCDAVVESDPTLLRVILQNLISNAIRYTRQGNVVIGCERRGDLLGIEVRDTGRGIPEAMKDIIFEEFYQLDNQARDRNKGTGIGLAIVKRIADLLNHPISMHSVEGEGSSLAIHVPLVDESLEELHSAPPLTVELNTASAGGRILLIEDDAVVLDANRVLLMALGYKVISASGAETAMRLIEPESTKPDLIIADYRLPGEYTGTDLVQQLRTKAGSMIPAIILTGDITLLGDTNALVDRSLLLQKPARAEELVRTINQLLGSKTLTNRDETAAE